MEEPLENLLEALIPAQEKLLRIREELPRYEKEDGYHEYQGNDIMTKFIRVLEENQRSQEEIFLELQGYQHIDAAVHYILSYYEHRKDDASYENLLMKAKRATKSHSSLQQYCDKLMVYYRDHKLQDKLKEELLYCLQHDLVTFEIYLEYKQLCSLKQWKEDSASLLKSLSESSIDMAPYFQEENMKNELFELLVERDYYAIKEYETYLGSEYRDRILALYVTKCNKIVEHADNQNYQCVYDILNHINAMPNTKQIVTQLLQDYKRMYWRRKNLWILLDQIEIQP